MNRKVKLILMLFFSITFLVVHILGCSTDKLLSSDIDKDNAGSDNSGSSNNLISDIDVNDKLSSIKEKIVSPPVVLSHSSDEELYSSGDRALIFIKGYADKDCSIEIYVNGILKQDGIPVDSQGYFETADGVEIIRGKNTVELVAVNPEGKKSKPTKFNLFLHVPQEITFSVYDSSEDLREIEDIYFVRENNPTVYIVGNCQPSSKVFLQVNDKLVGEAESDDEGKFLFEEVKLNQGNNELTIWSVGSDNLTSAPAFRDIMVYKDVSSPYPVSLSGYKKEDGNYLSWSASTEEDFLSYKLVRVEDPCINPEYPNDNVIATLNDRNITSYIDNDIEEEKSYYYTLWILDEAGNMISSNVLALPEPVYSISIERLPTLGDTSIGRREWYYQYYKITNTGNVTVNLQPMMVFIKLNPEPDKEMELSPLWEVHIWNPDDGEYYYSNESIYSTYIADWANIHGTTETTEETTYSTDGKTKIVTVTETTKKTSLGEGKRVMAVTVKQTVTETDLATGTSTVETTTDSYTEIVEPEKIGILLPELEPGEEIKIGVKIQNVSADDGDEITVHFHFAPVDCDGHFFTDEMVSTGDITVISSGRN